MATEDCNPQSAPGTVVKPIRKVTLNLSDGGKLRRLLTAHEAKCGEDLTASGFFSFITNRMAVQIFGFNPLMQRHGEFSSRMNVTHAGTRKSAANATKAT
jgi:hypothetical protein